MKVNMVLLTTSQQDIKKKMCYRLYSLLVAVAQRR